MDSCSPIQCAFITPEFFDSVVQFIHDHFLKDEPLNRSLGLEWSPAFEKFVRLLINQGTSVMAVDTSKPGLPVVGARIIRVVHRTLPGDSIYPDEEDEDLNQISHCKWKNIFDYFHFTSSKFQPFEEFQDIDVIVNCRIMAVHKEYRGQRISSRMMEFLFDFMRREQIQLAVCTVTSKFSRAVMERLGFEKAFEMNYKDYLIEGRRVFYTEEQHSGFAVMYKWV